MTKSTKGTHLTFDDRIEIQDCLNHGMTFKAIGKRLNKDQTTISKEVKRSLAVKPTTIIKKDKDGNIISNICPILLKAPFVLFVLLIKVCTMLKLLKKGMKMF